MSKIRELHFTLAIGREQWLRHYAGHANVVRVSTYSGQVLQLPASALRRFIQHSGIHGDFRVRFTQSQKLVDIEKLENRSAKR